MKLYTNTQISKALDLVNTKGLTRKEAAKKAKIGIYSLNYYLSKKTKPAKQNNTIILDEIHIEALKTLSSLL